MNYYVESSGRDWSGLSFGYVCVNGKQFVKGLDIGPDSYEACYYYEENGMVHLLELRCEGAAYTGFEAAVEKTFGF